MNANRTKPEFGKPEPLESQKKSDNSAGCVLMPLVIIISFFVLSAIVRYTSGNGSKVDQTICYGTLIVFAIIMLLAARDTVRDNLAMDKRKQQWKKTCSFGDVVIASRDGYRGGTYEDEYSIPHTVRPHYRLTLKIPIQVPVRLHYGLTHKLSSQVDVNIDVSESIYKKLENRDTVRIYYKPESPLTFLLEDEL